MRYTLTVGLLVCMPTVALLAMAGAAALAGNVRHRLGHAADRRLRDEGAVHATIPAPRYAPSSDRDELHDESLPCR